MTEPPRPERGFLDKRTLSGRANRDSGIPDSLLFPNPSWSVKNRGLFDPGGESAKYLRPVVQFAVWLVNTSSGLEVRRTKRP